MIFLVFVILLLKIKSHKIHFAAFCFWCLFSSYEREMKLTLFFAVDGRSETDKNKLCSVVFNRKKNYNSRIKKRLCLKSLRLVVAQPGIRKKNRERKRFIYLTSVSHRKVILRII